MAATIRDIKSLTGLSLATISKYLNGGKVLPKNKELIENAIDELHYEVNEIARGLVTNKTKTVGIMVYDIQSFFVGNMLHYIGRELRKCGYGLMICDSFNDEKVEEQNLKFLLSRKVDGILIMPVNMSGSFMQPAKDNEVPVVLIDRAFCDVEFDFVGIDNRMAAYRATSILIKNNHKKIGIIASDVEYSGIKRIEGFKQAMRNAELPIQDEYVQVGKYSFELGYNCMKYLLNLPDRPTGVFLGNYETTLGGIMAVNESSLSCPQDISIIGFDDLIVSRVVSPKISLVVQPMEAMCVKSVSLLLSRMEQKNKNIVLKINFSAVISDGDSIKML